MNKTQSGREVKVGVVQMAILILSILLLGAIAADTIFELPKNIRALIQAVDTVICGVFLVDFFVRLYRAESKGAFLKWGWIDLVASIPYVEVLRWGRVVRVLRIIRLLRGIRSVHRIFQMLFESRLEGAAVSLSLTAFLLIVFSSISILICERHGDANIKTAEDAVWWSVSTMTTVGYGDKYPVTTEGRLIGMALMIAGVGMFGGLSGLVASFFLGARDSKSAEAREILSRLDQLQAALQALRQAPAASVPPGTSGSHT